MLLVAGVIGQIWSYVLINVSIAKQIQPKLYLNNEYVKPVKTGQSFDFEISSNDYKTFVTSELNKLLEAVDKLPLHPKNKFVIYQLIYCQSCHGIWQEQSWNNMGETEFRQCSKQLYTIMD